MTATFTYTRIYADADGASHFDEVPAELVELPERPVSVSAPGPAVAYAFAYCDRGLDYDTGQHATTFRHLVIVLQGGVELEASDGEVRWFGPGSPHGQVILLEDMHGRGHISRGVMAAARTSVMVTLPAPD